MEIKFDVYFKKNLGTLCKDNEVDLDGKEAHVNLDLNLVERLKANYIVGTTKYTDEVTIKDIENKEILIPFKSDVVKVGLNEFEIVAYMKNGDVKVSQTYKYSIEKGIGEGSQAGSGGSGDGHTHLNLTILNSITQAKVDEWDNKSDKEHTHDEYANKNDVYSIAQTDNKIREEISKIELKEGPKGDKGEQGEVGPQGPKGDKGADGVTTSIVVNGNTYTHVDGVITLPNYPTSVTGGSDNAIDILIEDAGNNFVAENVEDALSEVSSQIKDIPKKTIVEGNKIYLAKNDGTKLDEGTVLPCSSGGTGGATVIASKLNGVKIGVLGDSVSEGNYHCYGDENADVKTWHEFIADKTGAIINNVSRGGSSLTTVRGDNYSFVDRYNNLNSDCKIILIFGGINDYAYAGNTELGNIGDTDTTNICGALKTLCEGLINKYPATPIGFILPYGFNEYKGSGTWKPYETKIIEVLNYYGIPYLNLRTNSIMNANIDFINSKYFRYSSADSVTGDKTHPNTVGHSIIAKPILSFIEDIYYDMYSSDIPSEVLPTSISIRETLSIIPGEQSTLAVTFIPSTTTNKYLTWSSNNESVATVSNGVVTGVSKGSCNIIATTSNGKTATCVVTVSTQSTSNYITEGLTNFWNPAGQEQQVTNWVDEIGNKVATISGLDYTQEGFEGNKLKLRAELSDIADSSSLNVPFEITENCTFEIALKCSTLSNNTYKIDNMLEIFTSSSFGLLVTLNGSANTVLNLAEYEKLTICSIALTKEGSNIKVIVNGVEKIVKTDDASSGNVNFFSYNSEWKACNDDIYSIKVYNRALNNDELLQNYEYYKTLV